MTVFGFFAFLAWLALLLILSILNDYLLAYIFSSKKHRVFVGLGVIIHELSHWVACLLTRTKVYEVVFFDETGGHVKHDKRGPVLMAFIAMAPLIGCALFMMFLAWLFGFAGVHFVKTGLNLTDPVASFYSIFSAAGSTLWINLSALSVVTIFFIVFLYLVWSVAACLAPSKPDLAHASLGMVILVVVCTVVILLTPLRFLGLGPSPGIDFIIGNLSYAIGIGIIMSLIPLVISLPVALMRSRRARA